MRAQWAELAAYRSGARTPLVDGHALSLAAVVAISRFRVVPALDESPAALARVQAAADFARDFVGAHAHAPGEGDGEGEESGAAKAKASMYGVTTGFGGSGTTTRVRNPPQLQEVLIRGLQAGVLPPPEGESREGDPPSLSVGSLVMPEAWARGAIAVRLNALIRGHSGCRMEVLRALRALLEKNITPCPPLRMSISASGDLGPLAYIAGAITGEGSAMVWSGEGAARTRTRAPLALRAHALPALPLLPKEGLAIVNGTAPSAAAAADVVWDAGWALLLSQALTSLTLEALHGTPESFAPFLHDTARPHPGQIEVAANVRRALAGSALGRRWEEGGVERLRQDRYCVRTAPQWLGPQVEEGLAALHTITRELNATTDNPIIDVFTQDGFGGNLCGGNFQGTSLTVALEKVRVGLQHAGRIAYAQLVELGAPSMNRGLAPDLAAGEPSLDYGQKALDVAASSYLAELSFVSNTVSNHVQPAEMHNQSVNSLALVAARYTATAVQLLYMIHATLLLSLCQAIDLRALYARFFTTMDTLLRSALIAHIAPPLPPAQLDALVLSLSVKARASFNDTSTLDTPDRFPALVRPLLADIIALLPAPHHTLLSPRAFHLSLAHALGTAWLDTRHAYFADTDEHEHGAAADLGLGLGLGRTRALYTWVRRTLGIKMRRGVVLHAAEEETDAVLSRVYAGLVRGDVAGVLLDVFAAV